jgi:hypothetical protein
MPSSEADADLVSTQSTFSVEDIRAWDGTPFVRPSLRATGYRGIWYTLGFSFDYGDKYSGGLGTYTANHQPMAVYAPAVQRTFFVYGGAPADGTRELAIMIGSFDHATGRVCRPVVLYFDPTVDDPHDNASIQIDSAGYIWVFKSGRGATRPGVIFRSTEPYSLDAFECIASQEFTYPQAWYDEEEGFLLLFAKYTFFNRAGPERALYWKSSRDGREWSADHLLAAFDGHYQTSGSHGRKIATFFNWHPDSDNDLRTNVYYAQTTDWGRTWTTADGRPLELPLASAKNDALIADLRAEGKLMYSCDLNFDRDGNPVLLFIVSRAGEPGPKGDPREWTIMHWHAGAWHTRVITNSGHNYDMGSLYIDGDHWTIIGPTGDKPQPHGTGGEMELWASQDAGLTWRRDRAITHDSPYNHSYARRPLAAADPFFAFWADGDTDRMSPSRLHFTDSTGSRVWRFPEEMSGSTAEPELLSLGSTL